MQVIKSVINDFGISNNLFEIEGMKQREESRFSIKTRIKSGQFQGQTYQQGKENLHSQTPDSTPILEQLQKTHFIKTIKTKINQEKKMLQEIRNIIEVERIESACKEKIKNCQSQKLFHSKKTSLNLKDCISQKNTKRTSTPMRPHESMPESKQEIEDESSLANSYYSNYFISNMYKSKLNLKSKPISSFHHKDSNQNKISIKKQLKVSGQKPHWQEFESYDRKFECKTSYEHGQRLKFPVKNWKQ